METNVTGARISNKINTRKRWNVRSKVKEMYDRTCRRKEVSSQRVPSTAFL
jgi:hypothetical protein